MLYSAMTVSRGDRTQALFAILHRKNVEFRWRHIAGKIEERKKKKHAKVIRQKSQTKMAGNFSQEQINEKLRRANSKLRQDDVMPWPMVHIYRHSVTNYHRIWRHI
jgi:hypothetical protein